MKDKFGAFYAALFDATLEKHKGAVVTEYAWQATTCDPCPGPALDASDFQTLGADVLGGPAGHAQRYDGEDFVLTRLHARYAKDVKNDLVFRQAPAIVGGREFVQSGGQLEQGSRPDSTNNFQARYAIRHPWTGPLTCASPHRGIWGGPTNRQQIATGTTTATNLAFAPRGGVQLGTSVPKGIPELDIAGGSTTASPPSTTNPPEPVTYAPAEPKKTGCGCQGSGGAGSLVGFLIVGLVLRAGGAREGRGTRHRNRALPRRPRTRSAGSTSPAADQQMFNNATQVVLMREGTRTVLSMQNNYKGPPDAFAMVDPGAGRLARRRRQDAAEARCSSTSSRWARRGSSSTGSRIRARSRWRRRSGARARDAGADDARVRRRAARFRRHDRGEVRRRRVPDRDLVGEGLDRAR